MIAAAIPLTRRQREVLDFIRVHFRKNHAPPSLRELGKTLNIKTTNGVVCHLRALRKKKLLTWDKNKARSIVLTEWEGICPYCGQVIPLP